MKFLLLLTTFALSTAAHAENCKVILQNGFDVEAAKILETKGFELIDETKLEDPETVWFRIYNEFERKRSTGEIYQVMRFNRDLETLVYRDFPGSREWQGKFQVFLMELPTCHQIYTEY